MTTDMSKTLEFDDSIQAWETLVVTVLLFLLHLSEQYFTSSQLFRHDFRHSIGFRQTIHILWSFIFLIIPREESTEYYLRTVSFGENFASSDFRVRDIPF